MEVNCEGCAGCCLDWRPLATDQGEVQGDDGDEDAGENPAKPDLDHERRGRFRPLDDTYNLAPLSGDEVRAFLAAGHAAAMTPRLFRVADGPSVTVGGLELAAVGERPAFLVGLRKVEKPVAPFGTGPSWLPTCAFLDPETLQCRIHGDHMYPETCATYPGDNLALDAETECERVERVHGGTRLVDGTPPDGAGPILGPGAVGARVFVHPDPDRIADAVTRLAAGEPTREDRAEFLAVAAASSPGTLAVNDDRYEQARERALDAESWVDAAIDDWTDRAASEDSTASATPDPTVAREVETARGAPETPGWPPE